MTKRVQQLEDTTAAAWVLGVVYALNARGLDGAAIAAQAGIDPQLLTHPDMRSPVSANTRLWTLAVELTGDPCFGLSVPPYVPRSGFGATVYAGLSSATLKEGYERMVRFWRGFTTGGSMRVEEDADRYRVIYERFPGQHDAAADTAMLFVFRSARWLHLDFTLAPLAVRLTRPEPACAAEFHRAFDVTVQFSQARDELEFSREVMERPAPAANADLARQLDETVAAYLARVDPEATTQRIRSAIVGSLPNGEPSQAAIAVRVGMSVRSLQRRLKDEHTTFLALVERIRTELAHAYLTQGTRSVSEVAFLLGFADLSSFSRAFKRWTGVAPKEYAASRGRRPERP